MSGMRKAPSRLMRYLFKYGRRGHVGQQRCALPVSSADF